MEHIGEFAAIADSYGAVLCDVWGVVHNGVQLSVGAAAALSAYRRTGGRVVLLTNAPRPSPGVRVQLAALAERSGVPCDFFDEIVTSGDVTRSAIAEKGGAAVLHIGPDRDLSFYDGLGVQLVHAEAAQVVSCTGLFDDTREGPEDYRERFEPLIERGLPMVCANPDIIVDRGEERVFCAGALAQLYDQMGGETLLVGKPHAPIYDEATKVAGVPRDRILAIGDGMPTDIRGANAAGIDVLFITGGIHLEEVSQRHTGDFNGSAAAVAELLLENGLSARAYMQSLK